MRERERKRKRNKILKNLLKTIRNGKKNLGLVRKKREEEFFNCSKAQF